MNRTLRSALLHSSLLVVLTLRSSALAEEEEGTTPREADRAAVPLD